MMRLIGSTLASLAVTSFILSACGGAPSEAMTQQAPAARGGELAKIQGTATIQSWRCGGAALPPPPQGPCVTTSPVRATFAIVRVVDASGRLELATYTTSDDAGRFAVDVPAGRYEIVSKFLLTHDPADQLGINSTYVAPFAVLAGDIVTKNFTIMTPPPPITIGVGN